MLVTQEELKRFKNFMGFDIEKPKPKRKRGRHTLETKNEEREQADAKQYDSTTKRLTKCKIVREPMRCNQINSDYVNDPAKDSLRHGAGTQANHRKQNE